MIARAAAAEFAFIECDMPEFEGRAGEAAVQRKEGRDRSRTPIQPRERDMRNKGARFGRDADAREQLVDLAVGLRERVGSVHGSLRTRRSVRRTS